MNRSFIAVMASLVILAGCSQAPTAPASGTPSKAPSAAPSASASAAPSASASPAATGTPAASATPAASGSPAAAGGKGELVTFETAGMSYEIPAGWKKVKEDGTVITSADEKMVAVFIEPEQNDIDEILKNIGKEIDKVVKDAKVEGEDSSHEINGMHSRSVSGTGKIEGKDAEWSVEVIGVKKPLIVVEFAEKGAFEANKATYEAFENSFRPAEGHAGSDSEDKEK